MSAAATLTEPVVLSSKKNGLRVATLNRPKVSAIQCPITNVDRFSLGALINVPHNALGIREGATPTETGVEWLYACDCVLVNARVHLA